MGVPFEIGLGNMPFRVAAEQDYGGTKEAAKKHPLSLFRNADERHVTSLPPVRSLLAESEPRRIKGAHSTFSEVFRRKGGTLEEFVLEGHDHLSPVLALSAGFGEEWGDTITDSIVRWMSSHASCES